MQAHDAIGWRRQGFAGQREDLGGGCVGLLDVVAAQEVGQGGGFAAGDLGGAEALLHEFKGGTAELGQAAFGLIEETGEELFGQRVDAVGGGGLQAHKIAAATGDFTQVMIGGIGGIGVAGEPGATGKHGFGDA